MKTTKRTFFLSFFLITILSIFTFSHITFSFASSSDIQSINKRNKSEPDKKNYGVYFYRHEPAFYTGFAPRCQDPKMLHIQMGRGNQLRVTVVLSDDIIDEYISDLALRYSVYSSLIKNSIISLSQNTGFEKFSATILEEDILDIAERRETADKKEFRNISISKLEKLNPGKIFHIKIDFHQRVLEWSEQLREFSDKRPTLSQGLDLLNDLLPTRMYLTGMSSELKERLNRSIDLYGLYLKTKGNKEWSEFYDSVVKVFFAASNGIYPYRNKMLDFYEYTVIFPVGTLNEFVKSGKQDIPLYPFPGKHKIHIHQRTRLADHIPDVLCYSYFPWIPYMHVGKTLHNSFHTLWFSIATQKNSFIPDEWKKNSLMSRTGQPYPRLWLLSRGPMSHGCTHVNAGHISELRQLLPSDESVLLKVETFRNKSYHFDVFDINGDGKPEVMGVKYFYAYTLKNKRPHVLRSLPERKPFYKWLYKSGYYYDKEDNLIFEIVETSKFIGRKAVKGKSYKAIMLYEADYPDENIQFYKSASINFIRELRRVSSTYDFDSKLLQLP